MKLISIDFRENNTPPPKPAQKRLPILPIINANKCLVYTVQSIIWYCKMKGRHRELKHKLRGGVGGEWCRSPWLPETPLQRYMADMTPTEKPTLAERYWPFVSLLVLTWAAAAQPNNCRGRRETMETNDGANGWMMMRQREETWRQKGMGEASGEWSKFSGSNDAKICRK